MKHIYLTPGPTELHPVIEPALTYALNEKIFSWSHRSKQFDELSQKTIKSLKELLNIPDSHSVFFVASGTEAMERVLESCVEKNSFHFVNGSFSARFFSIAKDLGKSPVKQESALGNGFDLRSIKIPKDTELICMTHNETSTGFMLQVQEIEELKRSHPDKLLVVDMVSSAPYPDFDYNLIDCAFFSVQKCFGLPAGLGVMIVGPKCLKRSQELESKRIITGSYHRFVELYEWSLKSQTPETPNILAIYLLGTVLEDLLKSGIETIRTKIKDRASRLYSIIEKTKFASVFVKNSVNRSDTVLCIDTGSNTEKLSQFLNSEGFIVGSGYGKFKDKHIRIANFPGTSDRDFELFVKALESFS